MKQYKTYTFEDNNRGNQEMNTTIEKLSNEGWEIKSKEHSSQGWHFGKTCCLGVIFLPLALLGKKNNQIQIIFEKDAEVQ